MKKLIFYLIAFAITSCTGKLDLKPDSAIVLPSTAKDLELILDNTTFMNRTPALPQISADEYFIPSNQVLQALSSTTARNASIWQAALYAGETNIQDWRYCYSAVFYANNVLDILATQDISSDSEKQILKGWALFARAYAFYNLLSSFAKPYEPSTANQDAGISIKLSSSIDEIVPRSSVQQSYDQVIHDLNSASELLQRDIIPGKRNRPSKVAAYAMLARVYLSMRNYEQAENFADRALSIYAKLTDFNTLNRTARTAFTYDAEETIFYSQLIANYFELTYSEITNTYGVDPTLINLYPAEDLRLSIYYQKNSIGNYNTKPINTVTALPFSGLATDELYLIKSECLARKGDHLASIAVLNQLLVKRWSNTSQFQNVAADNAAIALDMVLSERRKALVWRGTRWTDLRRLNMEGRNIVLERKIGEITYKLPPNSSRYVMPIPDDEITLSGVSQNIRE